jgi:hypothetical protein
MSVAPVVSATARPTPYLKALLIRRLHLGDLPVCDPFGHRAVMCHNDINILPLENGVVIRFIRILSWPTYLLAARL